MNTLSMGSKIDFLEDWDVKRVGEWLSFQGFGKYESTFRDNGISGDALIHLDHSALKDLGIRSVGQRLTLLRAIYLLKVQYGVPIDDDHYIPPTVDALGQTVDPSDYGRLSQDAEFRISKLESEINKLANSLEKLRLEMSKAHKERAEPLVINKRPSHKKSNGSLDVSNSTKKTNEQSRSDVADSFVGFRVTLNDPCYKVLPEALKKYNIDDDWRQYKLFICWGDQERCLEHDEKPLHWFQKLKEEKLNPVFRLRHIKHIKSPTATTSNSNFVDNPAISPLRTKSSAPAPIRETETNQVYNNPNRTSLSTSRETGTASTSKRRDSISASTNSNYVSTPAVTEISTRVAVPTSHFSIDSAAMANDNLHTHPQGNNLLPPSTPPPEDYVNATVEASGVAAAIFPYSAEREDELDVVVGDVFNIKSKSEGWWIVERQSRAIEIEDGLPADAADRDALLGIGQIGWVPAGCLEELQTTEMEEGEETESESAGPAPAALPTTTTVSSFISAIARADYLKAGPDELSVQTGDQLRVYKRYNNWVYAVNISDNAERGWLPSWYCGYDDGVDPNDIPPLSDVNGAEDISPSQLIEDVTSAYEEESAVDPVSPR